MILVLAAAAKNINTVTEDNFLIIYILNTKCLLNNCKDYLGGVFSVHADLQVRFVKYVSKLCR